MKINSKIQSKRRQLRSQNSSESSNNNNYFHHRGGVDGTNGVAFYARWIGVFLFCGIIFCLLNVVYVWQSVVNVEVVDGKYHIIIPPIGGTNSTTRTTSNDNRATIEITNDEKIRKQNLKGSNNNNGATATIKQVDTHKVSPKIIHGNEIEQQPRKEEENSKDSGDGNGDDEEGEVTMMDVDELMKLDKEKTGGLKLKILKLIKAAKIHDLDMETYNDLPTWDNVTELYGDKGPQIYGLEDQCDKFQNHNGDKADHFVSTAGTFNTGTNLMAELLINNCHMPARMEKYGEKNRGIRWQVNWGKHTPPEDEEFRKHHKVYKVDMNANYILPAVTIRDPYVWMRSMCRHPYTANFTKLPQHCPLLVPTEEDIKRRSNLPSKLTSADGGLPVHVTYNGFAKDHDSIIHMWNEYYDAYINKVSFSRILVRYEDLVFYPKEVTKLVCECAGGEMNKRPFKMIVESAKRGTSAHGPMSQRIGFIKAIIKYGSKKERLLGYEKGDLKYARKYLDSDIMQKFGYLHPPTEDDMEEEF